MLAIFIKNTDFTPSKTALMASICISSPFSCASISKNLSLFSKYLTKSFPVPAGITPMLTFLRPAAPFTVSFNVPSPPTA